MIEIAICLVLVVVLRLMLVIPSFLAFVAFFALLMSIGFQDETFTPYE